MMTSKLYLEHVFEMKQLPKIRFCVNLEQHDLRLCAQKRLFCFQCILHIQCKARRGGGGGRGAATATGAKNEQKICIFVSSANQDCICEITRTVIPPGSYKRNKV